MTNDKPFDFACAGYGWYIRPPKHVIPEPVDAVIRVLLSREMQDPDTYRNARFTAKEWNDLIVSGFKRCVYTDAILVGWAYYE